jgi:outer membrane lipoprotein-sorting protein
VNRFVLLFAAAAALRADSLEEILKRMDASARTFQSFTAKLKQVDYTDVLHESSESNGEIRVKRTKSGIVAVVIFNAPDAKMMHFAGKSAEIFYPKTKIEEIYDVGKYQGAIDRWIALGFGTSGAELRRDYEIKYGGPQTVGSTATTLLQLTPKSDEVKKLAAQVDLWIENGKSYPLQVKALKPASKDYLMFIYSDVKINPAVSNSDFELKLPADVRKIHPSK